MNLTAALDFNEWPVEARTLAAFTVPRDGRTVLVRSLVLKSEEKVFSNRQNYWTLELGRLVYSGFVPVRRMVFQNSISPVLIETAEFNVTFGVGTVVGVRMVPRGQPGRIKSLQVVFNGREIWSEYGYQG